MLQRLLSDVGASKDLIDKLGVFNDREVLEKYVVAGEMLDMVLSHVFGTGNGAIAKNSGALSTLRDLGFFSVNDCERHQCVIAEHNNAVERLERKVGDLERRFSALQRQIRGDIAQLVSSIGDSLDRAAACERQLQELDSSIREELSVRVSSVSEEVARLKDEVRWRAGDLMSLSEEVSYLKESEQSLNSKVQLIPIQLTYRENRPLDGILYHLMKACRDQVSFVKNSIIDVVASTRWNKGLSEDVFCLYQGRKTGRSSRDKWARNVCYYSEDVPDTWICVDFKERRVAPTSYSIASGKLSHLRSWVLEVSNDKRSWEIIDQRRNNSDLKEPWTTHNFSISSGPRGSFRFVRLRQIDKNHAGNDELAIDDLEIFGNLTDAPRPVARPGEFVFCDLAPLDGIIAHLSRKCNGNLHDLGVIEMTDSRRESERERIGIVISCWTGVLLHLLSQTSTVWSVFLPRTNQIRGYVTTLRDAVWPPKVTR